MGYDLDGNLTSDGRWDYAWDAENRLIAIQTHTALSPSPIANADARRLEFTYDYLGRRVEKLVRSGYNGSSFTAVTLDRKLIYDGWNLITERNGSTLAAVNSYVWGLDLTGTLQDGGGVGGLLAVIDATNSAIHQPYYDGNGNIQALVNRSGGPVTAAYEYSAFGETLRATGSFAQGNPFRFSSKYTDDETALLQFNRRYYDPRNGRFLGRDPIEEKGGLHLYGFCGNNPINRWDVLGMILQVEGAAGWNPGDVTSGDGGGAGFPGVRSSIDSTTGGTIIGTDSQGNWVVQFDSTAAYNAGMDNLAATGQTDRLVGGGTYTGGSTTSASSYSLYTFGVGAGPLTSISDFGASTVIGGSTTWANSANNLATAIQNGAALTKVVVQGVGVAIENDPVVKMYLSIVAANAISFPAPVRATTTPSLQPQPLQQQAAGESTVLANGKTNAPPASSWGGNKNFQLGSDPIQPSRNSPTTINGIDYSGHALDQMQNRGYVPSVIEDALQNGTPSSGRGGATIYYSPTNDVRVIVNDSGKVITVVPGPPPTPKGGG